MNKNITTTRSCERDLSAFTNDENGNVLWVLHKNGINLGPEHNVRFAIIFPDKDDSLRFGVFLLRHGYWVQVNEIDDKPGYHGEVLVDIYLETTYEKITEAEQWLAMKSADIGGKNDGWEIKCHTQNLLRAEYFET